MCPADSPVTTASDHREYVAKCFLPALDFAGRDDDAINAEIDDLLGIEAACGSDDHLDGNDDGSCRLQYSFKPTLIKGGFSNAGHDALNSRCERVRRVAQVLLHQETVAQVAEVTAFFCQKQARGLYRFPKCAKAVLCQRCWEDRRNVPEQGCLCEGLFTAAFRMHGKGHRLAVSIADGKMYVLRVAGLEEQAVGAVVECTSDCGWSTNRRTHAYLAAIRQSDRLVAVLKEQAALRHDAESMSLKCCNNPIGGINRYEPLITIYE